MIPLGFTFSAIEAGIKNPGNNRLDLGLVYCSTNAIVSGVFTTNLVKAAPVLIGIEQVKKGFARAIIVNAGNANACTGRQGIDDAKAIMSSVAKELGIESEEVIPMSTGTIGVMMPVDRIISKISKLVEGLSDDVQSVANSIMTTDTFPKLVCKRAGGVTVLGIAKGAGMIAPNMATTLAIVLTDAVVDRQYLDIIVKNSIAHSFNAITIDGDMSTNDTLIALSSCQVRADLNELENTFSEVIRELALMIVKDGEGATKFVTVNITGSDNHDDAKRIAMAVSNSLLVKTALFGADPNWGRIVAAVGYSGININPDDIDIKIQGINVVTSGIQSSNFFEETLHNALFEKEIHIDISVGKGIGRFTAWTTDISYKYVEINAQYRT